ncbi:MAG: ribonuclease HI family protein [Candidatus Omnitrophota bacterium]
MANKSLSELFIHVDGASRGNPGPASFGMIMRDPSGKVVKSVGQRIGTVTNNVAEYFGLVFAMQEALMMRAVRIEIRTDSELVVKQHSGEYKIKDPILKALSLLVKHLERGFEAVRVVHVPREENRDADGLANQALDEISLF